MSNETQQEQWNATHAQLLKSVADAQAKLLAAQNEISDRLADLPLLGTKLDTIGAMLAKLADLLPPPRRPVERLRTKQIVKRPPRKQRR